MKVTRFSEQTDLICPGCGSSDLVPGGSKLLEDGRRLKRYRCRGCGRKTQKPLLSPEKAAAVSNHIIVYDVSELPPACACGSSDLVAEEIFFVCYRVLRYRCKTCRTVSQTGK